MEAEKSAVAGTKLVLRLVLTRFSSLEPLCFHDHKQDSRRPGVEKRSECGCGVPLLTVGEEAAQRNAKLAVLFTQVRH